MERREEQAMYVTNMCISSGRRGSCVVGGNMCQMHGAKKE